MDPLSDVFSLLKVQSVLSARLEAAGPWAMRFPGYQHLKFGGVIAGARWLCIERVLAPVQVAAGALNLVAANHLRGSLHSERPPVAWPGALADARPGRALHLMPGAVARRWKVEDLAAAVGMSRTSFAERFRALVGLPPLEYLIRWRMA